MNHDQNPRWANITIGAVLAALALWQIITLALGGHWPLEIV